MKVEICWTLSEKDLTPPFLQNAKERERLFTIPKCVVPVIDEYGYTSLQAVLPTPLELIDPKVFVHHAFHNRAPVCTHQEVKFIKLESIN